VGYLDAIEKVTPDTVVVVCIYDQQVWNWWDMIPAALQLLHARLAPLAHEAGLVVVFAGGGLVACEGVPVRGVDGLDRLRRLMQWGISMLLRK
jgi:hypothetical protein